MAKGTKKNERMPLADARDQLVRVWLAGILVPTLVLVAQSILGKHGDGVREVWSWFIPLVLPTIGLMVGVLGGNAFGNGNENRRVRRFFFQVTLWLSIGYLGLLALTILLEPLSPTPGVALFQMSTYWLAPIQGLVVGALGYLFTAETKEEAKPGRGAKAPDMAVEQPNQPEGA